MSLGSLSISDRADGVGTHLIVHRDKDVGIGVVRTLRQGMSLSGRMPD